MKIRYTTELEIVPRTETIAGIEYPFPAAVIKIDTENEALHEALIAAVRAVEKIATT